MALVGVTPNGLVVMRHSSATKAASVQRPDEPGGGLDLELGLVLAQMRPVFSHQMTRHFLHALADEIEAVTTGYLALIGPFGHIRCCRLCCRRRRSRAGSCRQIDDWTPDPVLSELTLVAENRLAFGANDFRTDTALLMLPS